MPATAKLAATAAPVHSLAEILDSGRYHASLESNFRTRNRPEKRDTEEYRRSLVKRTAVRQLVLAALDEHQVRALAYPTLRRPPAIIGEPQRGSNCQLSPSTGLPVVAIPAGFADGGVPIGVELLGPDWSEPALLSMAYAYEQAVHPRRPPFSTPALVGGAAPAPLKFQAAAGGATVRFTYDVTTSRLEYVLPPQPAVAAAALHRVGAPPSPQSGVGEPRRSSPESQASRGGSESGPVITRLAPGSGSSEIRLTASDREALERGGLYLEVATESGSVARAQLRIR